MKKINLLLGILVFILFSCGGSDSSSDKKSDKKASDEPNNTIEEAILVDLGTELSLKIDKKGDVDWYKVEIKEQGYLQALAKGLPEDLDIQMRFAKYDEWGEEKEVFISNFSEMPTTIQILEEGTYYVMVAERWGEKFSDKEFTLKIDFIKEFDEYEVNNEPLEAVEIELDKEYASSIFPLNDEDWFKVNLNEQGYLQVKAKEVDEAIELAVYFAQFDEYDEEPINVLKSKDNIPQIMHVTDSGEYYIVLADRWNNKMSQKPFNWVASFIPEMDTFEPNNNKTNAKEITGNETLSLAIFPIGDIDMFKFNPTKTGTLKIKGTNFGNLDVVAEIFVLNEEDELEKLETVEIPGKYEFKEIGKEYYIGIKDYYEDKSSPEEIELIFTY